MKLFDIFKTNSTLKNEDLQKIKEETDFNQKEIKKSHKKFVALDKDKKGFVSTNDLASIPEVENNPLRYHIAQHMSDNKENGAISFESFIKVIDIFKNNKTDEQFRFMYNLFDIDNDGKISRTEKNPEARVWYATTKARQCYTDAEFADGDYLMFGKESLGIPEEILVQYPERCIRIPMVKDNRSLNLSNSVAVVLYEALRQLDFPGLEQEGKLHRLRWE